MARGGVKSLSRGGTLCVWWALPQGLLGPGTGDRGPGTVSDSDAGSCVQRLITPPIKMRGAAAWHQLLQAGREAGVCKIWFQ